MSKWHAPGMGEVHSEDDKIIIWCSKENDAGEDLACDETARMVCDRLNAPVWHKVEDVLPEGGQDVLTCFKYKSAIDGSPKILYEIAAFDSEEGKFYAQYGDYPSSPTHWTPLPEFKEES